MSGRRYRSRAGMSARAFGAQSFHQHASAPSAVPSPSLADPAADLRRRIDLELALVPLRFVVRAVGAVGLAASAQHHLRAALIRIRLALSTETFDPPHTQELVRCYDELLRAIELLGPCAATEHLRLALPRLERAVAHAEFAVGVARGGPKTRHDFVREARAAATDVEKRLEYVLERVRTGEDLEQSSAGAGAREVA